MKLVNESMRLTDVQRVWPETMRVFARHKLDCLSVVELTLKDAAAKRGLNLGALLDELNHAALVWSPPTSPHGTLAA